MGQDMTKVTTDYQEVAYALSVGAKINDFWCPWRAIKHCVSKHMRLSEPITKIWNEDRPIISATKMYPQWLYSVRQKKYPLKLFVIF